jgi:hypothetical protein
MPLIDAEAVEAGFDEYLASWHEQGSPWETWVEHYEAARTAFAKFINASPNEVAIVTSVSAGCSRTALESLHAVAGASDSDLGRYCVAGCNFDDNLLCGRIAMVDSCFCCFSGADHSRRFSQPGEQGREIVFHAHADSGQWRTWSGVPRYLLVITGSIQRRSFAPSRYSRSYRRPLRRALPSTPEFGPVFLTVRRRV